MFFVVLSMHMNGANSNNFTLKYEEMLWAGLLSFSRIKDKSFVQNRLYEYKMSEKLRYTVLEVGKSHT